MLTLADKKRMMEEVSRCSRLIEDCQKGIKHNANLKLAFQIITMLLCFGGMTSVGPFPIISIICFAAIFLIILAINSHSKRESDYRNSLIEFVNLRKHMEYSILNLESDRGATYLFNDMLRTESYYTTYVNRYYRNFVDR